MYKEYYLSLHRVFHSIRFKVNKGWTTAVVLFYFFKFGITNILSVNTGLQNLSRLTDKHTPNKLLIHFLL